MTKKNYKHSFTKKSDLSEHTLPYLETYMTLIYQIQPSLSLISIMAACCKHLRCFVKKLKNLFFWGKNIQPAKNIFLKIQLYR